jgi:methyltransferase-like protein
MIGKYGMQYLSESDMAASNTRGFPEEVRKVLDGFGDDETRREQYIDFLMLCRFRSTLICHDSITIDRRPPPSAIRQFRIASQMKPEEGANLTDNKAYAFRGNKDKVAELNHPLTKTVISELGSAWANNIAYDVLIKYAKSKLKTAGVEVNDSDVERTEGYLSEMFLADMVKLHRFEPPICEVIGDRPVSSRFARWQIENNCAAVTTMTGMNLEPDSDLVKLVILLSDGTRDKERILKEVAGQLTVPDDQRENFHAELPEMIETCFENLRAVGLLIG